MDPILCSRNTTRGSFCCKSPQKFCVCSQSPFHVFMLWLHFCALCLRAGLPAGRSVGESSWSSYGAYLFPIIQHWASFCKSCSKMSNYKGDSCNEIDLAYMLFFNKDSPTTPYYMSYVQHKTCKLTIWLQLRCFLRVAMRTLCLHSMVTITAPDAHTCSLKLWRNLLSTNQASTTPTMSTTTFRRAASPACKYYQDDFVASSFD